ncbi:sensor histidine kinase [Hyphomonas sp.]|uniref:sensor histidine kinase n=1 Tax=Hyphomonas sp. TaxID=87 RepID=UPI0039195771
MDEPPETEGLQGARQPMTGRARDFIVLGGFASAVVIVLALTTPLGLLEAIMGAIVISSVALAYYVGSASHPPTAASSPSAAAGRSDTATIAAVLGALPMPAFEIDREQRVILWNAQANALFKLDGRPAPPRAGAVIRSPVLLGAIESCIGREGPVSAEVEVETSPSGHWRVHIRSAGTPGGVLIFMEDLTPVKRAAQARADFLANASHELRTPLTALSGFIETMRGPAKEDKASWDRFLDIMAGESERMSRLIADLLSLSRIESTEHVLPTEREDFASIVLNAVDAMHPLAAEKGVTLEFDDTAAVPPVTANHDELIQVVENLISNALKYSGSGQTVRVSCGVARDVYAARTRASHTWEDSERMTLLQTPARLSMNEPAVWLRVEDMGPGIEREHLPRLGERFYRADQSRGGKITGTGLGLAIVKHIMAHHRGGLAVETRLGEGTAFGIWLPAAKDPV